MNISSVSSYPAFEQQAASARSPKLEGASGKNEDAPEQQKMNPAGENEQASSTNVPRSVQAVAKSDGTSDSSDLSAEEQRVLTQLQATDRRVRAHEQAHLGAAGTLARGGTSYSFAMGPDGRFYAVGGEVQIDSAPIPDNPRATIMKMEQVVRAALAPVDPSSQDRAVAADAAAKEARAQIQAESSSGEKTTKSGNPSAKSGPDSEEHSPLKNLLGVYAQFAMGDFIKGATLNVTQ